MRSAEGWRAWAAECCWEGRKPFWFGTVRTRMDAPQHEAEAEARRMLREAMTDILPVGVPLPDRFTVVPGMVWFVPEAER